jgi:hypothetical protein
MDSRCKSTEADVREGDPGTVWRRRQGVRSRGSAGLVPVTGPAGTRPVGPRLAALYIKRAGTLGFRHGPLQQTQPQTVHR